MFLNFKCDNFKSFQDGFDFDMVPEKRLKEPEYCVLKEDISNKTESALSVSVIYGSNAAGKSSVINAMSCMRQIVLRGNVNNMEDDHSGDRISSYMEMIPFAFCDEAKPVSFEVTFLYHKVKYCYKISIFLGTFLQEDIERYVDREQLYINEKMIFDRTRNGVVKLTLNTIKEFLNIGYSASDAKRTKVAMSNNIAEDTLLLTSDFSSFCSKKIVAEIKAWFKDQFLVINSAYKTRFMPSMRDGAITDDQVIIIKTINQIAKEAGIIGTDLAYAKDPATHMTKMISVLSKDEKNIYGIDSDQIESDGTLKLVSIMPAFITAMRSGAVLVIDELDASLHPEIVMNLISVFHNDSVNINGAQLIFNTHNTVYLNNRLLRRDEIRFVERDADTKSSYLYTLSDFRANGKESVRKTSDYTKNYLMGRYGAIPDSDFTNIFVGIVKGETGNET